MRSGQEKRLVRRASPLSAPIGLCGQHQEQQDALQRLLAMRGVVPLVAGVDAASVAAGADADRCDAERERNVRVRGGDARLGADAEMAVDSEQVIIEGGPFGRFQAASRAVADALDSEGACALGRRLRNSAAAAFAASTASSMARCNSTSRQTRSSAGCGAKIEARAGALRNRR